MVRVIIRSISYLRATHARRYWRLDQRLDSQESSQGRGIPPRLSIITPRVSEGFFLGLRATRVLSLVK